MADGGLKFELDEALSARVRAAADAVGRPVEDFATNLIAYGLDDDWAESYARFAEYERTGESVDVEVALAAFHERLAERFRSKRKPVAEAAELPG
jgi:hypothetical protein